MYSQGGTDPCAMISDHALSPAQHHGAPLVFSDIRSYTNLLFTLLFTIECLLKITSFGCRVTTVCLYVSGYVLVSTKYISVACPYRNVS